MSAALRISHQWDNTSLPHMITPRHSHAAVSVGEHQIVVAGGEDQEENELSSAELLDIRGTRKWQPLPPMTGIRPGCAAAAIGGEIYVIGGCTLKSAEMLDLENVERGWQPVPDMKEGRVGFAAAAVGTRIVVTGGYNPQEKALKSVELYDTITRQWTTLPPMSTERSFHAAVAINESFVVVVGGSDGKTPLSSMEILNVNSGKWTSLPNMPTARYGCAAAIVDGAFLVVAGGHDRTNSLSIVETYDLEARLWSKLPDMHSKRSGCAVVMVGSQAVIMGGYNGPVTLSSVETLAFQTSPAFHELIQAEPILKKNSAKHVSISHNLTTQCTAAMSSALRSAEQWDNTSLPPLLTPRSGHVAVTVGDHQIVVAGGEGQGEDQNDIELSSAELLDIRGTRKWQPLPPMTGIRPGCAAAAIGGEIYVIGGCTLKSAEMLDLENVERGWQPVPDMKEGRVGFAAAAVGTRIVVTGGYNPQEKALKSVELYDTITRQWTTLPPMSTERSCHAAVTINESFVVVVGGSDGKTPLSSMEILNVNSGKWKSLPNMPTARGYAAVIVDGAFLVVAGGYDGTNILSIVEAYDLEARLWSKLPDMHSKRAACAAVMVGSQMVVTGGKDGSGTTLSSVEALGPTFHEIIQAVDAAEGDLVPHLGKAIPVLKDLFQLKLFYTHVSTHYRIGTIDQEERVNLIKEALETSLALCTSPSYWAFYRIILDKAFEDGIIDKITKYRLEGSATETHIENADFIKEMQTLIQVNAGRIKGLEQTVDSVHNALEQVQRNVEAVNGSLDQVRKGIRRRQQIEAAASFTSVVLNLVSFGIAGSALQGVLGNTLGNIVDFGDIPHLRQVVELVKNTEVQDFLEHGIQIGGLPAENKLREAVKEKNTVVLIAAAAATVKQSYKVPPVDVSVIPIREPEYALEEQEAGMVGSEGNYERNLFEESLGEKEARKLPVFAAIKHGNLELLEQELTGEGLDINQTDSRGRSAADFAAIMGEKEMMELVRAKGGECKAGAKATMISLANERADAKKLRPQLFQDDEHKLPIFVAILEGELEDLKEELEEDGADINQLDSRGRSAADFAAIMGEIEIMTLILNSGGKFAMSLRPTMKKLARKRAAEKTK